MEGPAQEFIFKGATRPPMLAGVPMMPLVLLCSITLLFVFWVGNLVSFKISFLILLISIPAYMWMRMVCMQDDQRLTQMLLLARLLMKQRNRRFWQARAYSPIVYRIPRPGQK